MYNTVCDVLLAYAPPLLLMILAECEQKELQDATSILFLSNIFFVCVCVYFHLPRNSSKVVK